jgi:hypothetical protein
MNRSCKLSLHIVFLNSDFVELVDFIMDWRTLKSRKMTLKVASCCLTRPIITIKRLLGMDTTEQQMYRLLWEDNTKDRRNMMKLCKFSSLPYLNVLIKT